MTDKPREKSMDWDELMSQLDSISLERKQELELIAKLLSRIMVR